MSNRVLSFGLAVSLVLIGAGSARAQHIRLAAGDADLTMLGTEANARAGVWMDRGALNNGDGRRDLVIGAPGMAGQAGRVYVLNGGPEPHGERSLSLADTIITSTNTGDLFGSAGAIGNILNAEGSLQRNLVVGAPSGNGGTGAVYLFQANFAPNTRITTSAAFLRILGNPGDQLGSALATADLDHDTFREIIIGARGSGRVYVVRGSTAQAGGTINLATQPSLAYMFGGPGFGDVLAAGDVTGDGFSDVVVGAPSANAVHLYAGISSGPSLPLLPANPVTFNFATNADDQFGASLWIANVDSDSIRDIVIGAPNFDGIGRANSGAVFVLWGSATLPSHHPSFFDVVFYGENVGHRLGSYVTTGSANRDDIDDLLMLAPGADAGSGELSLYYGRAKSGFGVDIGGGRRGVDLAVPGSVDRKIIGLGNPSLGIMGKAQIYEHTGEGAGDVIVSSPSSNSNSGVVFFTVSPKFVLSGPTATFRTNNFTATTFTIGISNPSIVNVTWTASANQPWITIAPSSGHVDRPTPGPLMITVSSHGMPLGTHTGRVRLMSTSIHLDMTIDIPVTLIREALTPPVFLTVTPGAGGLSLRWGAVPGAASYTVWRIDASGAATALASGITGTSYLDPNGIPAAGFRYTVTATNATGQSAGSTTVLVPFGVAGSRTPTVVTARDYDGDGKDDVTVYRTSTGDWLSRLSGGGAWVRNWGSPGNQDQPVPADYDGDGRADTAVYRGATGDWIIAFSSNGSAASFNWGNPQFGDVPVPADYDGDGRADVAVYRVATGAWIVYRSQTGTVMNLGWGTPEHADTPVPADYDGDGKADVAIYRGTTGQWYVLRSSNGALMSTTWGVPSEGDVPVPADFDNDGRTDFAVYRSMTGQWFVAKSGGGFINLAWGAPSASDVPVVADFDGDGKADIAVYRFTTGQWLIVQSSNGAQAPLTWGGPSAGDTVRFF